MTKGSGAEPLDRADVSPAPAIERAPPGFAHASEAEFARILDFYQVEWRYEPHLFPILWSLDGDVLESFAPDFFLPELDLYVEMTTLRQKLVRKKNRKLRRLRELYPDIRIKLFYARDFRALMLKYGRVALADALSGAEGQFPAAAELDRPAALDGAGEPAFRSSPTDATAGATGAPADATGAPADEAGAPANAIGAQARTGPSLRTGSKPRPGANGRTGRGQGARRGIIGPDRPAGSAACASDEGAAG